MLTKSFKQFCLIKEAQESGDKKDWKKEFIQLDKGFIPPPRMRPIINAFLNSADIKIMDDTSKEITMPKKNLFLVGGSTRDFLKGKSPRDYHLATNATPAQTALILDKAGFRMIEQDNNLKLPFAPKPANESSKKTWFTKGKDGTGKPYSIVAKVLEDEFEICTLRKDPKTETVDKVGDFVDNPHEDANGRDLTINALYLDLTKPDGENNKLYDPTGKGWHDAKNDVVRAVGKAEDRFKEDKSRVLRAVRFHCRFGKTQQLDTDIKRAMEHYKDLDGVTLEKMRDEFLKGLLHPDTNIKRYITIYKETGLINKLFPEIDIHMDIPPEFSSRRDKPLALAWLLQDNPIETVVDALAPSRMIQDKEESTGWNSQEKRAVLFLLALKEFKPENRPECLRAWKGTGLTKDQIKDWVDMFTIVDSQGRKRNRNPTWALHVRSFADHDNPLAGPKDVEEIPDFMKNDALDNVEIEKFMKLLPGLML